MAPDTVRQRGGETEQRHVDEWLLLTQVHRGEERVCRIAELGDGHDRHHLGRRVERVVPPLAAEPASPGRERMGRGEPVQVHRSQLTGVGAERRHAVRAGNLAR